jgi:hypothetical protein
VKVSLAQKGSGAPFPVLSDDGSRWYPVCDLVSEPHPATVVEVLAYERSHPGHLAKRLLSGDGALEPLDPAAHRHIRPFAPLSYRDFMLYEQHCIDAARGFVRKYLPHLSPVVRLYETVCAALFPSSSPENAGTNSPSTTLATILPS